jgi:hypothetical protein
MGVLLAMAPSPVAYAAPAYAPAPCQVEVPDDHVHRVRCGVLTVPERRGEGSDPGRTIKLPVVIIASRAATPAPDPVVVPTTGGPAGGTLSFRLGCQGVTVGVRYRPSTLCGCARLDER